MFREILNKQMKDERERREAIERKYQMTDNEEEETGRAYSVSIELRGKLNSAVVIVTPIRNPEGATIDHDAEFLEVSKEFIMCDHHYDELKRLAIDLWQEDHPDE